MCGRASLNSHSTSCHVPKCRDRQVESGGAFRCEECDQQWPTHIGLSQHKRHAHPEVRNAERIGGKTTVSRRGAHGSCWSEAEGEALQNLETLFSGRKNINKLIVEELGSKTYKQVCDKQMLLRQRTATHQHDLGDDILQSLEVVMPLHPPGEGVWEALVCALAEHCGEEAGAEPLRVVRAWAENADQAPYWLKLRRCSSSKSGEADGGASTIHGNTREEGATRPC